MQPTAAMEQSYDGSALANERHEWLQCQFEYATKLLLSAAIRFWWTTLVEQHIKKTGRISVPVWDDADAHG